MAGSSFDSCHTVIKDDWLSDYGKGLDYRLVYFLKLYILKIFFYIYQTKFYRQFSLSKIWPRVLGPWFAIILSGSGRQCQPPTPAGSDSGTNNIFFYVTPPTWPP